MVDHNNTNKNKKRKEFISEGDIATLLQRYDTATILKLLQEMSYYAESKMDWNELVKKTTTGITDAREYQLLWRHLAYRHSLDDAQIPDDESDMECELEASPAVGVDAVAEAVAHVKVMVASYVPSESDIAEDSMVEAPLTINIPYALPRGPQEPSNSYWSSRGMNITFPVSLQKDGLKRKRKWSAEEDEELYTAVQRHGEGKWITISSEEFDEERSAHQLSQRWAAIKKKGDTPNASTQSGIQRTEEKIAANRAFNLAVGNGLPSKKHAVGTPPMRLSGSISGAQPNGANNNSSVQGQRQSQSIGQRLARTATPGPTAKSRLASKKATGNPTSRAELMETANSVAAAACMSGLGTSSTVPKNEPGKNAVSASMSKVEPVNNAVPASVPKVEPGKNAVPTSVSKVEPGTNAVPASMRKVEPTTPASAASLPSPLSSAMIVKPVETTLPASLPRTSATLLAPSAEPVKTTLTASLPRTSATLPAPSAEPVKAASVASSAQPTGIAPARNAEPVKAASVASSAQPTGIAPARNAEPVKAASVASSAQPSGIAPARNVEPVKAAPAASSAPPSRISPARDAEPVKTTSAGSLPRPSGTSPAANTEHVKATPAGSVPPPPLVRLPAPITEPMKTASGASLASPSGILSSSKSEPGKTASTTSLPRQPGIIPPQKAEPGKTASTTSLPRQPVIKPPQKAEPGKTGPAASLPRQAGIIPPLKNESVKNASAVSSPLPSAPNAEPVKSSAAAATKTQAVGSLNIRPTVNGSPHHMVSSLPSNKPLSKGPTIPMTSISAGFASSRFVPPQRAPPATVIPQKPSAGAKEKPNAGAAVTATSKPVGVQKEQTQGKGPSPVVTSTPQPNKTVAAAKMETPPSNMPKKTQVLHTNKSLLAKPPVKETGTAASPIIIADSESNPKVEASKGKSPNVATVTGQKGL